MSYAYHPLSRVGAFTKGNSNVRTYQTQIDLYEVPVRQCADCMAPVKSLCTCTTPEQDERRAARDANRVAKSAAAMVDWKPAPRQEDADTLRLEMIERHIERMKLIPVSLVGAYLSGLPKSLRTEIVSYL